VWRASAPDLGSSRALVAALVAAAFTLLAQVGPARAAGGPPVGVQSGVAAPVVGEAWAGYDVLAGAPAGALRPHFTAVSGSWTQPAATCLANENAQASFWVGLGGALETSAVYGPLQVGTDSDCFGGRASYFAWYEANPEPVIRLAMRIRPGDPLSASVTMGTARNPTVTLRDGRSGAVYRRTLRSVRVGALATDSAEWIVEGPYFRNPPLLADFGTVTFTDAQATEVLAAGAHTGGIADPAWRQREPDVLSGDESGVYEPRVERFAAPGPLSAGGEGFSVGFGALGAALEGSH
jgi:Peptidase A4 family